MGKGRAGALRCFCGRHGASGKPLALLVRRRGEVRGGGRGARAVTAPEVDLLKYHEKRTLLSEQDSAAADLTVALRRDLPISASNSRSACIQSSNSLPCAPPRCK